MNTSFDQVDGSVVELILGCFDHAFLINRSQDKERLSDAMKECLRIGITPERIEAIVPAVKPSSKRGYLGNALSHLHIYHLIKERGLRCALILEDDVVFRTDFLCLWGDIAEDVLALAKADIFWFYRWSESMPPSPLRALECVGIKTTLCTHCYGVYERGVDKLISIVERKLAERKEFSVDRIFHAPEVVQYAPNYNLAGQGPKLSTITGKIRKETAWGK